MKESLWFLALIAVLSSPLSSQELPPVEREFRAAWIATVANIDFPSKKTLTIDEQKAELIRDLELARRLRLNAVIFQVRPMADAVYRSKLEPWSEFLTGQMGRGQSFDPLEFVVAEAHKRGILVHAWFNPYRAYHPAATTVSDDHISKRRPDLVRQYGRYLWLDPTDEEVKRHSVRVVVDVAHRYDIDGVHFDDYFYPYPEKDSSGARIEFPDDKNWQRYLTSGGKLSRDDWRRSHVNDFIETVGREVKRVKPQVVYGISPFGIWQPMPDRGITGFNQHVELYADARKWLQDGTVDYLAPQLYWESARAGQSFPVLLDWWREQNTRGRFVWPGIASYRIGSTPTFTAGEISDQIGLTRKAELSRGAIHFSFKSLRNDVGGIQNVLATGVYSRDSVIPSFSWIKTGAIQPPAVLVRRSGKFVTVRWIPRGKQKPFWFVVYIKDKAGWSYSVLSASERAITLSAERKIEEVIVKSVDRLGNISQ